MSSITKLRRKIKSQVLKRNGTKLKKVFLFKRNRRRRIIILNRQHRHKSHGIGSDQTVLSLARLSARSGVREPDPGPDPGTRLSSSAPLLRVRDDVGDEHE